MSKTNKYGLTRDIPDPIKREVRQQCGFGCVVCGGAIYEYHHFDPPYEDAKEHKASGIVLLCPLCHTKATTGRLSKETLNNMLNSPRSLEVGYSHDNFDVGNQAPTVILAGNTIIRCPIVLQVRGESLLQIDKPEFIGAPYTISAVFYDKYERKIAQIVRNEWQGLTSNWDIELVGKKTTIRHAHKKISLIIRTEPPDKLIIEQLEMYFKGLWLVGQENGALSVNNPAGRPQFSLIGCTSSDNPVGLSLS